MKAEFVGFAAVVVIGACGPHSVDLGGEPAGGSTGHGASGGTGDAMNGGTGDATRGGSGGAMSVGGSSNGEGGTVGGRGSHVGGTGAQGGSTGGGPAVVCGDGVLEGDEVCDDGNTLSGDGCNATCSDGDAGYSCAPGLGCIAICGDGILAGDELCDDGNRIDDDGCPNDCGHDYGIDCKGPLRAPAAPAAGEPQGPCDIYAADGGPCVAAHSTARALYATYDGPLYQVKDESGATLDISVVTPGGLADSAAQDSFCGSRTCTIAIIYDQSGHGNHLTTAPGGMAKNTPDNEAAASAVSATFAGQKVYGVHVVPGVAYRNNAACDTATGDAAETEYAVVGGTFYNNGCCFDYGNMERGNRDDGEGAAEAIYFGATTIWGRGDGAGPWVMGDLENGLWAGSFSPNPSNKSLSFRYVTAMLKGDAPGTNHWAIKTGDAQAGPLTTPFDGQRPSARYNPMRKQGAIGLGTAGDNSTNGQGDFFEGVMTTHYSSDAADDAVQANIASVYGAP